MQSMEYQHTFIVQAPLIEVIDFHTRSNSMGAITPPPIRVQVHAVPDYLANTDRMDFSLWFGPFPVRWIAQIETVSDSSFIDQQLEGPFKQWQHTHTFLALEGDRTQVRDDIKAELKHHPIWWLVGAGMWLGMPILFAYRGWKTRKLLQRGLANPE